MDIDFSCPDLRAVCNSKAALERRWGLRRGDLLAQRLAELQAIDCLEDLQHLPHINVMKDSSGTRISAGGDLVIVAAAAKREGRAVSLQRLTVLAIEDPGGGPMSSVVDQPERNLGYDPDHAVPAGATLRELLANRDMTQSQLADRIDVSLKHVNQMIHGVAPITPETALALEKATRVSAAIWNRLESNYRDRLARLEDRRSQAADSQWLQSLPLKELQDRGYLTKGLVGGARVDEVCRFFGVANRQGWERVWRAPLASFRRSKAFASDVGAVASWLRIGELRATEIDCAPFDAKAFRKALHQLRELTRVGYRITSPKRSCGGVRPAESQSCSYARSKALAPAVRHDG